MSRKRRETLRLRSGQATGGGFCRPYRTRFHFLRLTQDLRPGLSYAVAARIEWGGLLLRASSVEQPGCISCRAAARLMVCPPRLRRASQILGGMAAWNPMSRKGRETARLRSGQAMGRRFVPSLRDLVPLFQVYPGLTSWAIVCRRYATGVWWFIVVRFVRRATRLSSQAAA
jgi:hypothetical protein